MVITLSLWLVLYNDSYYTWVFIQLVEKEKCLLCEALRNSFCFLSYEMFEFSRYLCITMELVPLKFWSRLNSQCVTFIKKLSKFKAKKNFSNHHSLSAHSFLVCVDKIYFCVFNLIDFFHFLIFFVSFFSSLFSDWSY